MQSEKIVNYLTKRYNKKTLTPKEARFEMGLTAYSVSKMRENNELQSLSINEVAKWIVSQD